MTKQSSKAEHTGPITRVVILSLDAERAPVVRACSALAHVQVHAVARDGRVLGEGAGVDSAFSAGHDEQDSYGRGK